MKKYEVEYSITVFDKSEKGKIVIENENKDIKEIDISGLIGIFDEDSKYSTREKFYCDINISSVNETDKPLSKKFIEAKEQNEKDIKLYENFLDTFDKLERPREIIRFLMENAQENKLSVQPLYGDKKNAHPIRIKSDKIYKKLITHADKDVIRAMVEYQYIDYEDIQKLFFKSKDMSIRKEILKKEGAAPFWSLIHGPEESFFKFIETANDDEMYLGLTNKKFSLSNIGWLISHRCGDESSSELDSSKKIRKIKDKVYRNIISILEHNPNVMEEPDFFSFMDGYSAYASEKDYKAYHGELKKIKKLRSLE